METFGDGVSLEARLKTKEHFEVTVVTVGNRPEDKKTHLAAELLFEEHKMERFSDPGRTSKRVHACARESLAKCYFSLLQPLRSHPPPVSKKPKLEAAAGNRWRTDGLRSSPG